MTATLEINARTDQDSMHDIARLAMAGVMDEQTARRLLMRCVQISIAGGPWEYLDGERVPPSLDDGGRRDQR